MSKQQLIAILPGDGVGPEVIAQATRVLELYREKRCLPLRLWHLDLGADRYLKDGTTYPKDIADRIRTEARAVLLGALGDPRIPSLDHARDILFGMRFGLDLYANVRPVKALADRVVPLKGRGAKDVDFVVFRENTEGIYVGMGGQFKRGTPDEIAINEDLNTRKGVERLIVAGFEYAKNHGHKVVHMADKSNAMKHAHELWYRCFFEVAAHYPGIEPKHLYVDALCFFLVQDPTPFKVIVTNNLFGDIVTDLGAAFQGGLGMAASANVPTRRTRRASRCSSPSTVRRRRWPGRTSPTRWRACSRSGCCCRTSGIRRKRRVSRGSSRALSPRASARATSAVSLGPGRSATGSFRSSVGRSAEVHLARATRWRRGRRGGRRRRWLPARVARRDACQA